MQVGDGPRAVVDKVWLERSFRLYLARHRTPGHPRQSEQPQPATVGNQLLHDDRHQHAFQIAEGVGWRQPNVSPHLVVQGQRRNEEGSRDISVSRNSGLTVRGPDSVKISVRIFDRSGSQVVMNIKRTSPMFKLFTSYADCKCLNVYTLTFYYRNHEIDPNHNPIILGMSNEDAIHCDVSGTM